MKIDDNSQSVVVELFRHQKVEQQAAEAGAKGAEPGSKPTKSADKVDISPSAGRLNETSTLKGPAEIRSDKVAQVKAQIEAGTYQVSGKAVAEKMLTALSKEKDR